MKSHFFDFGYSPVKKATRTFTLVPSFLTVLRAFERKNHKIRCSELIIKWNSIIWTNDWVRWLLYITWLWKLQCLPELCILQIINNAFHKHVNKIAQERDCTIMSANLCSLLTAIDSKKMRNLLNSRKSQSLQLTVYFLIKRMDKNRKKVSTDHKIFYFFLYLHKSNT